jgi:hypothetical protein
LGLHSYDPGISPTLVQWIVAVPEGNAGADFDAETAHLDLRNICSVLDAFSVPNSLNPLRPMGNPVGAEIESLDIEWSGLTRSVIGFSDPLNQFRGNFFECSASIQVAVHTDVTTGHGFRFVSSQTTAVNFAQFGREWNGSFF